MSNDKYTNDLIKFKEKVAAINNQSENSIETAKELINELSSFSLINTTSKDLRDKAFEEISIISNYINSPQFQNNDNTLIVVKEALISSINILLESPINSRSITLSQSERNIFIVHGHKDIMTLSVSDTLRKLGLTPIILHEQVNQGRTIIEKFEDEASKAKFAIVLLSPDDYVNIDEEYPYRARQNVILELGYFCGKYGRKNIFALYDISTCNKIELPSDISGVLYDKYDEPFGKWRYELVKSLNSAGYLVDLNLL